MCPIRIIGIGYRKPVMKTVTAEHSILRTLAYFDMFHYPLSLGEVYRFVQYPAETPSLQTVLQAMEEKKWLYRAGIFYSLRNDPSLAPRREAGNLRAEKLLTTAYRIGRFLYRFPFVRGIGISGSLSKNYADADADIDFFVITAPGRLWLARSFMHLFKKLSFLWGRQDWYCMNYYIDLEALQIQEQNIFTATEVITLVPLYGDYSMPAFFRANKWATVYFPNQVKDDGPLFPHTGEGILKTLIEKLLSSPFGSWLDDALMQLTSQRWRKKEERRQQNRKGEPMGIRTGKHFSRPNPEHFQRKILETYAAKLRAVEEQLGIAPDELGGP